MGLRIGSQALALLLLVSSVDKVAGQWTVQCLSDIKANANVTNNLVGLLDTNGHPVSNIVDATAISYSLCTSACGRGSFQWPVLSQDFSSWLLPYLALISQLPFGAEERLDNLMSAILTVGSPALAGYSLFITLLNSRWINRRFRRLVPYPNSYEAVSIVSSLQQFPLKLCSHDFPSLIVLPENDRWWEYLHQRLTDYGQSWSAASETSIAWVIIAYSLSLANSSQSDSFASVQADGRATGSIWLWLISIVVGWLLLSPKCDFKRLKTAYDQADQHARTALPDVIGTSTQRALTIIAQPEDGTSSDELLTPPIFNYSRSLSWAYTAETMFQTIKAASKKAQNGIPVNTNEEAVWTSDSNLPVHPNNRRGSPEQIRVYCRQPAHWQRSHWVPGVFTRMAFASFAGLALQWGTVGGAIIEEWFTPTIGMGCRSLSYLLYGVVSTIIWMMLLISSILAHYSAAPSQKSLSARVPLAFSICLRRMGKLLAILNSLGVIAMCILQYSDIYDNCFCNSSMISRGQAAYITIIETSAQAALEKTAWYGAHALSIGSAIAFVIFIFLLLDSTVSTKSSS